MIHPWIALLFSHVAGDFLLQPNSWIRHKFEFKARSVYLYLHVLIHGLLFWSLMGWPLSTDQLLATGILMVSHFFIDWWKLSRPTEPSRFRYFITDQAAHVLVLISLAAYLEPEMWSQWAVEWNQLVLLAAMIIGVTTASSHTIQAMMRRWDIPTGSQSDSLKDAGKFIGYMERLLIFFFVIQGIWTAVGFLLAAKSVFRFSDLSRAKDRKLTEYILIGTLCSFGMGIAWGLMYQWLQVI